MVNFRGQSITFTYYYTATNDRYAKIDAVLHTDTNHPCDISLISAGNPISGSRFQAFFLASTTAYSDNPALIYDATYTGTVSGSYTTTEISAINRWISSNGENSNFTRDFNITFGTSYTRQQVFQALQTLYGTEYKFFAYVGYTGTLYRNPSLPGAYSFYNVYSDILVNADYCSNWPGHELPEGYSAVFNGTDHLIDPAYISTIGDNGSYYCLYHLGRITYTPDKLRFNVYIDGVIGEKGPNITINWTNLHPDGEVSELLVKPHVFAFPVTGFPEGGGAPSEYVDIKTEDGVVVPWWAAFNEKLPKDTEYAWEASYSNSYVGEQNNLTDRYNTLEKVTLYGIDGIPNWIRYFLRFDYTDGTWGDLYYVNIPYNYEGAAYISAVKINNGFNDAPFDTEVIIIGGMPEDEPEDDPDEPEQGYDDDPTAPPSGDGPYPDPGDQPDLSQYDSTGYPGEAVLTKTYKLTKVRLQDVGNKLWTQSYFDVLKIQNNPIENIIACRWYPMNIVGAEEEGIVIGDVSIGTNGEPIPTTYRKTIGTYTYKGVVSNNGENLTPGYLAQTPYTTIKLHLPYVGVVQLDASEIYNRQLHIEYIVDIITGDILVLLKLGSKKEPYMSLSGKMGVDIPLSGSDRAQIQIAAASRTATAMMGAAGQMIAGNAGGAVGAASGILSMAGMDYSSQRVLQHSSVCASYDNRAVVLEMQVNKTYVSKGYAKYHGLPSHQYMALYQGMGFVQISKRTIIDVAMTDEENRMLEAIMTGGCYF